MAGDNPYAARSSALLPTTIEMDGRTADALTRKSLPDLQSIYEQLLEEAERGEKLIADGGSACACDVAYSQLLIVISFSINKLDGGGRYEDWMEDESIERLTSYRELVGACGDDAGSSAASGITDEMILAL